MTRHEKRQFDTAPPTPADLHDVEQFVNRTFDSMVEGEWTVERAEQVFQASARNLRADTDAPPLRLTAASERETPLRQRIERVRDSDRIPMWRPALAAAAVVVLGVSIAVVMSILPVGDTQIDPPRIATDDSSGDAALHRSEYLAGNNLTKGVFDSGFDAELDDLSAELDDFETELASRPIEEASIYLATSEFDDWMDEFEENLDTF